MNECMYVCMYVCTYVCMYVRIHIFGFQGMCVSAFFSQAPFARCFREAFASREKATCCGQGLLPTVIDSTDVARSLSLFRRLRRRRASPARESTSSFTHVALEGLTTVMTGRGIRRLGESLICTVLRPSFPCGLRAIESLHGHGPNRWLRTGGRYP